MAPDPVPSHPVLSFGTGYIPDDYDKNDKVLGELYGMQKEQMSEVYQAIFEKAEQRTKITLEDSCPPVYNQLDLGSCVANATAAALRFAWKNSFLHIASPYTDFDPSRLWIYYYARLLAKPGVEFRDTGCQIRNALKVLKKKGVCSEEDWKYLDEKESQILAKLQKDTNDGDAMPSDSRAGIVPDTAKTESSAKFFDFGFDYHRIRSLSDKDNEGANTVIKQMCTCLSEGFPIIFGFGIYWESDGKNKEFHNPKNWEGDVFNGVSSDKRGSRSGGHAVLCVGFDRSQKRFRVMNSWGPSWKGKGYFWMPFSWFEQPDITYDLWTIRPDIAPLLRDHDPIE